MFKKLTIAGAAFALGATALIPVAPAMAQRYDRGYSQYDQGYGYNGYNRGYRGQDRRYYNNRRNYNGCKDGDGGTVIGAIAGGLAGHELAGRRGDRTLGVILGGALGAVAGRAIDRADPPQGCRRSR
ncbi:glycine zipper 2TM domain-containing protein [Sphingomonas donggukensis]|uniref:17 kDa surface antigen n=1 Tax=Sphingomonas donggukensis TaxID=2949093 RepID=A0ABY4TSG5_9SPHN|nr:glycine zipper 2TM domain-containing protein [Sphingomonas donggukensis]URW75344.1 glycine zipper 2TM domain-containing protein [Sphingomonas donggukensis]